MSDKKYYYTEALGMITIIKEDNTEFNNTELHSSEELAVIHYNKTRLSEKTNTYKDLIKKVKKLEKEMNNINEILDNYKISHPEEFI